MQNPTRKGQIKDNEVADFKISDRRLRSVILRPIIKMLIMGSKKKNNS
jgi:hypothetical protein